MGKPEAREFMSMLLEDRELRSEFLHDPRAALARSGIGVDDDDVAILEDFNWEGTEEELRARLQFGCECAICVP